MITAGYYERYYNIIISINIVIIMNGIVIMFTSIKKQTDAHNYAYSPYIIKTVNR